MRRQVRSEFLAESWKHKAVKVLRQIPCIGPIRAALLLALMQTPHRFRSKRQLWTYSGLGVETHDSSQHCYVEGRLQRSKKPQQVRGLNQNHLRLHPLGQQTRVEIAETVVLAGLSDRSARLCLKNCHFCQ